jgi:di/tricarboxylate transporter
MEPRRSTLDWFLEFVSAISLIAAAADVAMHWSTLPERIPTHFGVAGNPDGWGGKNMLLLLLALTLVVAILLTVAESYQRLINIPIKVDRESPQVRGLLRSMVIALKAVITLIFVWIVDLTMRTAVGEANGLGRAFLPVFLGATFAPMIYYLVKLKRL